MNGTASGTGPVRALVALLLFGAVSALAGGIGIAGFGVGAEYLARTPFPSLLIPGLILILVVGGTQLAAAVLLIAKKASALLLAGVAGFGMVIWIFVELVLMAEYSWLQSLYFGLGILELVLVYALLGIAAPIVGRWPVIDSPDSTGTKPGAQR
ncbi:hypothetical protein [Arthrobacter crystallopoietes]|uniref:hypothetical protein n=1 Tax=Crystallibacter crystallopoietes TaxID=37928 RepID=UPI0011115E8F|nr:hypothetical protein [Arthrobacter crystallopoietes]